MVISKIHSSMVVAEERIQACGQGKDTLAYRSHAFSHVQQQWGTLYGGREYEGCFWEMVCEVQGRLGICRACSCLWEISKFFPSAKFPSIWIFFHMVEFLRLVWSLDCEFVPSELNQISECWSLIDTLHLQYRISNVNYNITSGNRYPVPNKSAPVYITVGDGGNQEGLASRWEELKAGKRFIGAIMFTELIHSSGLLDRKLRLRLWFQLSSLVLP